MDYVGSMCLRATAMLRDKFNWVVLFEGQMRGAYGIEDG